MEVTGESLAEAPPPQRGLWRWACGALGALGLAAVVALIVVVCMSPGPQSAPTPSPSPSPPSPPPVADTYVRQVCTADLYTSSPERRFSVWAPHAAQVSVVPVGHASWVRTRLVQHRDFWEATVPGVQPGDGYNFEVDGFLRIDPCALDIAPDGSHSVVAPPYTWQHPRRVVPLSQAIIYEMHIGSFTPEGTFAAAAERLDYLAELGVTVLEFMPVMYFCGDHRSWGYNPCAPLAVKPEMGGSLGLRKFVDAANGKGLVVALDTVFNHLAPDNLLLNYDGDFGDNGIYFYSDALAYVYGFGVWGPRPRYSSETVRAYITDSFAVAIDEFHIGGFRWDASMCVRRGVGKEVCFNGDPNQTDLTEGWYMLQLGNNASHGGSRAGTLSFAEDMGFWNITMPTQVAQAGPPDVPGGAGFDAQWIQHPEFQWQFKRTDPAALDVKMMIGQCAGMQLHEVVFSETHDTASKQNVQPGRIPAMVKGAGGSPFWVQKATFLYLGLVLTCPATPLLLQEQELFSFADFTFPNPPSFDWSLVEVNSGQLRLVRDLIALRRNTQGFSGGLQGSGVRTLLVDGLTAAVLRFTGGGAPQYTIVVYNMDASARDEFAFEGVPVDGRWAVRFNGDLQKYSELYGDSCATQAAVTVTSGRAVVCAPAASLLILSLDSGSARAVFA